MREQRNVPFTFTSCTRCQSHRDLRGRRAAMRRCSPAHPRAHPAISFANALHRASSVTSVAWARGDRYYHATFAPAPRMLAAAAPRPRAAGNRHHLPREIEFHRNASRIGAPILRSRPILHYDAHLRAQQDFRRPHERRHSRIDRRRFAARHPQSSREEKPAFPRRTGAAARDFPGPCRGRTHRARGAHRCRDRASPPAGTSRRRTVQSSTGALSDLGNGAFNAMPVSRRWSQC